MAMVFYSSASSSAAAAASCSSASPSCGRMVLARGPGFRAGFGGKRFCFQSSSSSSSLEYSPRAASPPEYTPSSPSRSAEYSPLTPPRRAASPDYTPDTPEYTPRRRSPSRRPASLGYFHTGFGSEGCFYASSSPEYSPLSYADREASPEYTPLTPSPQRAASPDYTPSSPSRGAASPEYTPATPDYTPLSYADREASPEYTPLTPSPRRAASPESRLHSVELSARRRVSTVHACHPGVHVVEPSMACCFAGLHPQLADSV